MTDRDVKPHNVLCCPLEVAARGNDMVALTCHRGAPSVYQSGDCTRCGGHALEKHRVRTGPTAVRSVPLDLD